MASAITSGPRLLLGGERAGFDHGPAAFVSGQPASVACESWVRPPWRAARRRLSQLSVGNFHGRRRPSMLCGLRNRHSPASGSFRGGGGQQWWWTDTVGGSETTVAAETTGGQTPLRRSELKQTLILGCQAATEVQPLRLAFPCDPLRCVSRQNFAACDDFCPKIIQSLAVCFLFLRISGAPCGLLRVRGFGCGFASSRLVKPCFVEANCNPNPHHPRFNISFRRTRSFCALRVRAGGAVPIR